jgi:pimeloyl-ACP methyl ester carboxylesterase
LVINGEFDEAQDVVVEPWLRGIPTVQHAYMNNVSHMALLEEPHKYINIVANFLA